MNNNKKWNELIEEYDFREDDLNKKSCLRNDSLIKELPCLKNDSSIEELSCLKLYESNKNILKNYKFIDFLGTGTTSYVLKIQNINDGNFYAAKCLNFSKDCGNFTIEKNFERFYELCISKYIHFKFKEIYRQFFVQILYDDIVKVEDDSFDSVKISLQDAAEKKIRECDALYNMFTFDSGEERVCFIMNLYDQLYDYVYNTQNTKFKYKMDFLAMVEQIIILSFMLYEEGYTHGDLKVENLFYAPTQCLPNIFKLECPYRIMFGDLGTSYHDKFTISYNNYYENNYKIKIRNKIKATIKTICVSICTIIIEYLDIRDKGNNCEFKINIKNLKSEISPKYEDTINNIYIEYLKNTMLGYIYKEYYRLQFQDGE